MDDAKIHPGQSTLLQVMVLLDGYGGGDREPQPPTVGQQGDRPNLLNPIWQRTGQPYPQLGVTLGHRQPQPLALNPEGTVVEPYGNEGALAPREPSLVLAGFATLGGLEPRIGVPAQYGPRGHHRKLPEGSRAGQLTAQLRVPSHRPIALLLSPSVAVQKPSPDVPGRP
jgi:hypothetical protein